MAKTLEITSIPDELHDALVARAEKAGVSVSELVVRELVNQDPGKMSPDELQKRLRQIPPVDLGDTTIVDLINEGREERTDQILGSIETPERTPEEREAVRQVLRDVQALPEGATNKEIFEILLRLPRRPPDWTSADVIREYRGPLSIDDSELRGNGRR
ncbi:MAG TPA: hypothetical protein VEK57_18625 [Thermoanaerobaculia bacterium]|nr:hypothetical protein [Thermoanaerobaculia bacterium]